ncbi:hypothetical protein VTN49DRAFT_5152 [Thermomyces lanuginosus]|uniref:uncharacterized protein n=1 Tax=Thermomyces lanuginosus TaxID=5541 RepID=UPI0037447F2A
MAHQHWTLEDWKNVIWPDETSVVLGHSRAAQRVWRAVEEATDPTCVRRRWRGLQEFIFWGCFSYDKKGPCHIYVQEPNSGSKHERGWPPTFKFSPKNGKLVRKSKGGLDWWRYLTD